MLEAILRVNNEVIWNNSCSDSQQSLRLMDQASAPYQSKESNNLFLEVESALLMLLNGTGCVGEYSVSVRPDQPYGADHNN
jgi:hypothetical protein